MDEIEAHGSRHVHEPTLFLAINGRDFFYGSRSTTESEASNRHPGAEVDSANSRSSRVHENGP